MTVIDGNTLDGAASVALATMKHRADLSGVSETALLTLQARAGEARRPDGVIDDPTAVSLVDSIDFDFAKFGHTRGQGMALRAIGFDDHTRRYLTTHPTATVVALAEGLQTSFYRLDASGVGKEFRWLTVDLSPIVDLRTKLLPESDRVTMLAQSALDYSWMDHVDPSHGVFITAEGLLMYLQPEEAMGLISACAKRFPGGQMMFDLPPSWAAGLARRGTRASRRYRMPAMPFSLSRSEADDLVRTVPGVRAVHHVQISAGRGVVNTLVKTVQRFSRLQPLLPVWLVLEFG